jgi:hypothetical protein
MFVSKTLLVGMFPLLSQIQGDKKIPVHLMITVKKNTQKCFKQFAISEDDSSPRVDEPTENTTNNALTSADSTSRLYIATHLPNYCETRVRSPIPDV